MLELTESLDLRTIPLKIPLKDLSAPKLLRSIQQSNEHQFFEHDSEIYEVAKKEGLMCLYKCTPKNLPRINQNLSVLLNHDYISNEWEIDSTMFKQCIGAANQIIRESKQSTDYYSIRFKETRAYPLNSLLYVAQGIQSKTLVCRLLTDYMLQIVTGNLIFNILPHTLNMTPFIALE